ncbi:MAG: hypothetical protein ABSA65_05210 [Acidimicrobiales bacterium]
MIATLPPQAPSCLSRELALAMLAHLVQGLRERGAFASAEIEALHAKGFDHEPAVFD